MKALTVLSVAVLVFLAGFGTAYLVNRNNWAGHTSYVMHPVIHAERKNDGTFTISSHCPAPLSAHLVDPEVIAQYKAANGDPISTINVLASAVCK